MAFLDTLTALGPVAAWPRNEAPGATVMADMVGALDGIYGGGVTLGAPALTDDPGITGASFDGVDDWASTPLPDASFATYTAVSLVTVAAVSAPNPGYWYSAIRNEFLDIYIGNDGAMGCWIQFDSSQTWIDSAPGAVSFDSPMLFGFTWDGALCSLYLQDTLIGTAPGPLWRGSVDDTYYASSWQFSSPDVMVQGPAAWFDKALTAGDMAALAAGVGADNTIETSAEFQNDGYILGGRARVWYDQPIVPAPVGARRRKVQQVHQSLPAPTLVDGRPT